MEADGLEANAVQAFVDGDIEGMGIGAAAKLNIAGDAFPIVEQAGLVGWSSGYKCQLFASGINHLDARASQTATGQVDVSQRIHSHAIASVLLAKIDQSAARTIHKTITIKGKSIDLHGATLRFWIGGFQTVATVIVIADIERFLVWAEDDAIGFFNFPSDLHHLSINIETIHRLAGKFLGSVPI